MSTQIINLQDMTGSELRELARTIRINSKDKPYEVFKAEMQVVVDEVNRRGKEIAKKHNRRYVPVNTIQTMRG